MGTQIVALNIGSPTILVQPDSPSRDSCRQAQALLDFHGQSSGAETVYERLGNVTSPMLIIAGQQDHVDPMAGDLALLDAVPGAAIVEAMPC